MKNRLLMIIAMLSSALILTACWSENAVEEDADGASLVITAETEEVEESEEKETAATSSGRQIKPLSVYVDMNNPEDCTLPAAFKTSDINLEAMEMTYTLYSKDYYDAVDINMLQIGDTLLYDGKDIIVESIEDRSGDLFINGGLDMGGCELRADDGGTYVAHGHDDAATFSEIGRITLPLSETLEVSDSINNPNSPVIAGYNDLEDYIGGLEEWSSSFTTYNTTVEIRAGKIVAITRIWTP